MLDFEISVENDIVCEKNYQKGRVSYFVICKKDETLIGGIDVFNLKIAGEKVASWVERACENAQVFEVCQGQDELEVVLPYLTDSEYTVVISANIPLITKQYLKNLVRYVCQKQLNVCKFKSGFIAKTEYLENVREIIGADVYEFNTKDFFEIVDYETFCIAKTEIQKRIADFHSKNKVFIEDSHNEIDASVVLSNNITIGSGSSVLGNSNIGEYSKIGKNVVIENCQISSDASVGDGAILKNCKVLENVVVGDGTILEDCEVGNNCNIGKCNKIFSSKIDDGVKIKDMCDIINSNLAKNSLVGSLSRLFKAEIAEDYEVYDGKVIIHRLEDKK